MKLKPFLTIGMGLIVAVLAFFFRLLRHAGPDEMDIAGRRRFRAGEL
jgi:hypothetical protein